MSDHADTTHNDTPAKPGSKMPGWLKTATDFGPLLLFFGGNWLAGPFVATAALMAGIAVALGITYSIERRIPPMPIVTGVFVLIFGTLTLVLHDEAFIQIKVTVVDLIMAGILAGGLAFNRLFLKIVTENAFDLTDRGWRVMTYAWIAFFLAMAGLNEVARMALSFDAWTNFKVFGMPALTLVFAVAQVPLITKYQREDEDEGEAAGQA